VTPAISRASRHADCDAVIVGSGINSLVAAATLARGGWRVHVLERNDELGGAIRTAEITVPGFTHDVFSAWHPLFVLSGAYAKLGEELRSRGLEYLTADLVTATLFPDGEAAFLSRSPEANTVEFDRHGPGDGRAFQRELDDFERNADISFAMLSTELAGRAGGALALRALRRFGRRGLIHYSGELLTTSRSWLEEAFTSPRVQGLLAPWVLHTGLGPDAGGSGFMNRAIASVLQTAGLPVARGGGNHLVDALAAIINDHGGDCRTGAEVERVLVSGGRAAGVRLAGGRTVTARRAVLCNVTPPQLYETLLADCDLAPAALAEGRRYRFGRAGMQIHYALSSPPRWDGDDRLSQTPVIHLTPGLNGVSRAVNEADRGLLPHTATIVCGQPCAVDASRAPDGSSILWIQLQELPVHPIGDAADEIDVEGGIWTESLRERYADRIQARLVHHISNLESSILRRVTLSPADIEAANPNLRGGDIYSGSCDLDQSLLWRPRPGLAGHRTPIRRLYQIGASTHPGPGLGAGSGEIVARHLLGRR
jgi:phytoene dehydrogenase-like protein